MFTVALFCEMSLHADGSTSAWPPSSHLVNLMTSLDFIFPRVFCQNIYIFNAINIDAVIIIIDIIILIMLLTLLTAIQDKIIISKNPGKYLWRLYV